MALRAEARAVPLPELTACLLQQAACADATNASPTERQ